ncbi:MAG TPA: methyltransferase domain-containing protein [Vicinamibacterales bacterium]|nr:methyltransferase domain-containing protein [Vicinamibacterales bacterium]
MSPSPFVAEWVERLARELDASVNCRRALDVAAGRGRHLILLARAGFCAFGVDARLDALRGAVASARNERLTVRAWCADLTQYPLPIASFDVVVVTRFLQRDLFPALQQTVRRGGFLLYETFTTWQRALGTGPASPDHLLEPGELRARFDVPGWETRFYEETRAPEAVARIVGRRSG